MIRTCFIIVYFYHPWYGGMLFWLHKYLEFFNAISSLTRTISCLLSLWPQLLCSNANRHSCLAQYSRPQRSSLTLTHSNFKITLFNILFYFWMKFRNVFLSLIKCPRHKEMSKFRNLRTWLNVRKLSFTWLDGLVGKVLSCRLEGRGSIPELMVLFS